MAEPNARDAKVIQYLNEAYGKEKQLEQALQGHIKMAELATYKKRLQEHLKETKNHARQLERRIKKLGGTSALLPVDLPDPVENVATKAVGAVGKAAAAAQGAVHAVRGTSDAEKQLRNARDEFREEAHEIAQYTAIQTFAETVGDDETAKLVKGIIREEQRMASYLEKLIPRLAKDVAKKEIPAAERRSASTSRSRSRSSGSTTRATGSGTRTRSGASSSRSTASRSSSGSSRSSSSRSSGGGSSSSRSGSSRSSSSRSSSGGSSRSSNSGSGSSSRSSSSRSRSRSSS